MNCVKCNNEINGFRDPRSLKEYKVSGMCQDCQDRTFGTEHLQLCEECGVEIPKGEEITMSNYAVCSDRCAMRLVGLA
jgi:hypothetical protein